MKPARILSILVALGLTLLLGACTDQVTLSGGLEEHTVGTVTGVNFLPPIGDPVVFAGTFDPGVSLGIEIFNLDPDTQQAYGSPIGPSFSTADGTIHVVDEPGVEEQYHANWDTSASTPEGTMVRVEVRLDHAPAGPSCNPATTDLETGCLAFFDVELFENMGQAKKTKHGTTNGTVEEEEVIDLVDGRTLPIKLHIERGVVPLLWNNLDLDLVTDNRLPSVIGADFEIVNLPGVHDQPCMGSETAGIGTTSGLLKMPHPDFYPPARTRGTVEVLALKTNP